MGALAAVKRLIGNSDTSAQLLSELRAGAANEAGMLNEKLDALLLALEKQSELLRGIRDGISNETRMVEEKMRQVVQGVENQSRLLNEKLSQLAGLIK